MPSSASAAVSLSLVYFLMTGFSLHRLLFVFSVRLPGHALLVKHADKRHGVNGSLCHVHHKIRHTAATEAAPVVTQLSSERALHCFGFSCLKNMGADREKVPAFRSDSVNVVW